MFWPATTSFWTLLPRRSCAAVALLAYLVTSVGLPLPGRPRKDHTVPFPCQDNPCGCQSAQECWQNCCCNTPEQRRAWAEAHGVTPPAYAVLAPRGWDTRPQRKPAPAKCDLCATVAAECEGCERPAPSCCKINPKSNPAEAKSKATPTWRWRIGITVFRCRGISLFWLQGGSALPPPPIVAWLPAFPLVDQVNDGSARPLRLPHVPPKPPPRFAV